MCARARARVQESGVGLTAMIKYVVITASLSSCGKHIFGATFGGVGLHVFRDHDTCFMYVYIPVVVLTSISCSKFQLEHVLPPHPPSRSFVARFIRFRMVRTRSSQSSMVQDISFGHRGVDP